MQNIGIDDLGAEVLQRTGERLHDLGGDGRPLVVGQAIILPVPEGEFGLEEQIFTLNQAGSDRRRDGLADPGFVIVAALVGGVDAAETLSQGRLGQRLRSVLLPGGSVQNAGHADTVDGKEAVEHRSNLLPRKFHMHKAHGWQPVGFLTAEPTGCHPWAYCCVSFRRQRFSGFRYITPSFITSFTFRKAVMFLVGSPSTAMRSASRPGWTAPTCLLR